MAYNKRVLRYLKETEEIKLTGYTDANEACDIDDKKSIGAYCIYLGHNLISWSSKKQSIVTKVKYREWIQSSCFCKCRNCMVTVIIQRTQD